MCSPSIWMHSPNVRSQASKIDSSSVPLIEEVTPFVEGKIIRIINMIAGQSHVTIHNDSEVMKAQD
jgi:hypothetical protein